MSKSSSPPTLTDKTYNRGISELTMRESDLGEAVSKWGHPPFWVHAPGFPGMVIAILSQQVSLESAQAAFVKLENVTGSIIPETFLSLDDNTLREIGFSRQKASYVRDLAHKIRVGDFGLEDLESMDNNQARKRLMKLRGIGPWTADTYLLFSLRRSDAWPSGDLALAKAIQELRRLDSIPSYKEVDSIAAHWRPWRAVAARILWHFYLSERGRS
ncbi:MAG: DNA-3-methyladenine glycosylase 2 family protein [Thermodesulfobacteriota bacterium]|nr:DNA-3-methyladenine glycosylase 2 family protein [Thermodesulfobacteriota bacterium]